MGEDRGVGKVGNTCWTALDNMNKQNFALAWMVDVGLDDVLLFYVDNSYLYVSQEIHGNNNI